MRTALSGTIVLGVPVGAVPYTFCSTPMRREHDVAAPRCIPHVTGRVCAREQLARSGLHEQPAATAMRVAHAAAQSLATSTSALDAEGIAGEDVRGQVSPAPRAPAATTATSVQPSAPGREVPKRRIHDSCVEQSTAARAPRRHLRRGETAPPVGCLKHRRLGAIAAPRATPRASRSRRRPRRAAHRNPATVRRPALRRDIGRHAAVWTELATGNVMVESSG